MDGQQVTSIFDVDKTRLLENVLDRYGARYDTRKMGYQQIRCINTSAHPRGDRTPSASINLGTGRYRCFACDLAGDGFDLMLALEGTEAIKVLEQLNVERKESESRWLPDFF